MEHTDVQEIKEKLDIVEVIREYLPQLKQAGSNWKGHCPFHNEKTPSFTVSSDKQIFHCFGCNEGGDIFTFVMKINGYEFPEALSILAEKSGVTLYRKDPKLASTRNTLFDIHTLAASLYHKKLLSPEGNKAREYLKKRNLADKTIKEMQLGYSPDEWDKLTKTLTREGYSGRDVLGSGLSIQSDSKKMYDRFRNRIMLPLVDIQGRIVGFTGRTISEQDEKKSAKYINSPQTELYSKSKFIYGLHKAKSSIRTEDEVIVVEGNFDWLSLYQAGFTNTVAISGTALTNQHLYTIKRYTQNIVFALDVDDAGKRALEKSIKTSLENDMNVFVIDYHETGAKDPDEVMKNDTKKWKMLVSEKKVALAYLINEFTKNITEDDITEKKRALKKIAPFLASINNIIEKEHFIKKSSDVLRVSLSAVTDEIKRALPQKDIKHRSTEENKKKDSSNIQTRLDDIGWQWIALILAYPDRTKYLKKMETKCITQQKIADIFSYIQKSMKRGQKVDYKKIRDIFDLGSILDTLVLETEERYKDFSDDEVEREILEFWINVKKDFYQKKLQDISERIHEAEQGGDAETVQRLIQKQQELLTERTKSTIT